MTTYTRKFAAHQLPTSGAVPRLQTALLLILEALLWCAPSALSLVSSDSLIIKLALTVYYLFVPGLLLGILLKVTYKNTPLAVTQTLALSLIFLLVTGFTANSLLPSFSVSRPLDAGHYWLFFNGTLFLTAIAASANMRLSSIWSTVKNRLDELSIGVRDVILLILSAMTLVLFFFGANLLNNGGSNLLTVVAIVTLVIATFFCLITQANLSAYSMFIFIYASSLGLLLSYSLRSAHVMGFDVSKEFYVFQLTQNAGRWLLSNYVDPYNACLSITILPTVLSNLVHISGEYIYKFLFQMIFAFIPVTLYFIFSKLASKRIALAAACIFMFQLYFIQQLPALVRQEIAFLFFALVLDCVLAATPNRKNISLLYLFSFGLIVSHYSTAYFWMFTLIVFYLFYYAVNKLASRWVKLPPRPSITYLSVFILGIVLWFGQLTTTASSLGQFVTRLPSTFSTLLSSDQLNNDVSKLQFQNNNVDTQANLVTSAKQFAPYSGPHTISPAGSFQPAAVFSASIGPSVSGIVARLGAHVVSIVYIALTYALEVLGMVVVALKRKAHEKLLLLDLLALACIPLVGIILLVPTISQDYNLSRAYTQLLILFAPFAAVALFWLYDLIRLRRLALFATATLLAIFLLYNSGVYAQYFGGPAYETLDNFGFDYDKFYTTTPEVAATQWLSGNYESPVPVYADEFGILQLQSRTNISRLRSVLYPSLIDRNSYVYLRAANVNQGLAFITFGNQEIEYEVPSSTLTKNMNTIYSAPGVRILH